MNEFMNFKLNYFIFYGLLFSAFVMLSIAPSSNGLALLSIPFLLLFIFSKVFFLDFKLNLKVLFFSIGIQILLILNLLLTYFYWRSDFSQIGNFILATLGVLTYFSLSHLMSDFSDKKILKAINFFIIFNLFFFLVQVISYYLISLDLNFGLILGGAGNRALNFTEIYRPTGIYDEPAIYGLFMSVLIVSRLFFEKKVDILVILGIVSLFFTFSFVSILLAFGIIFILLADRLGYGVSFVILILMIGILFLAYESSWMPDFLISRMSSLLSGEDGSTSHKFQSFDLWLNNENVRNFGFGFIGLREWTPDYFDAIYDMTLYGTIITQFGLVLAPFFILWIISFLLFNGCSVFSLLLCFLIFIKLSAVHFLVFWVFLAFYQRAFYKLKSKGI
ncbi:hypothetical protein ACJJWD_22380 [Comamonas testosteroni]|uniref:hypothetical protein n=1 Tax=Comamonas testosteroni TaxID=285 RepID=UPI00389AE62A